MTTTSVRTCPSWCTADHRDDEDVLVHLATDARGPGWVVGISATGDGPAMIDGHTADAITVPQARAFALALLHACQRVDA